MFVSLSTNCPCTKHLHIRITNLINLWHPVASLLYVCPIERVKVTETLTSLERTNTLPCAPDPVGYRIKTGLDFLDARIWVKLYSETYGRGAKMLPLPLTSATTAGTGAAPAARTMTAPPAVLAVAPTQRSRSAKRMRE